MDSFLQVTVGVGCLVLFTGGAYLTFLLYADVDPDTIAIRLILPILFFVVLLAGHLFFGLLTLFDKDYVRTGTGFWTIFFTILGTGIVFSVKNIVAPFFLGLALSWALYYGALYGNWELIPIYSFMFDYLLFWAPEWINRSYTIGSLIYLLWATLVSLE